MSNKKGKLLLADVASTMYAAAYIGSRKKEIKLIKKRNLPEVEEALLIQDQIVKSNNFNLYTENLDERLESMFKYTGCTHYILFGDTHTNFRKKEFTTYKANRVKEYRKFSSDLTQYCIDKYNLIRSDIFESDDMLTFLHKYFTDEGWEVVLGAIDSDMVQVPNANIYNFNKFSFNKTDSESADFYLYRNILLAGHNNEISLKGCGEVKAEAYLKQFKNYSQYKYAVLKAYIQGIPKGEGIKSAVKGYGLLKGTQWFADAFRQSYLIREMSEVQEILDIHAPGTVFEVPEPIKLVDDVIVSTNELDPEVPW